MKVRHLLKGGLPDGMPKTDAVVWEGLTYCARDPRDRLHERGASVLVHISHIIDVDSWNDENMAWVGLAKVNEGKCFLVFKHDTGLRRPVDDAAEDAVVSHVLSMQA